MPSGPYAAWAALGSGAAPRSFCLSADRLRPLLLFLEAGWMAMLSYFFFSDDACGGGGAAG